MAGSSRRCRRLAAGAALVAALTTLPGRPAEGLYTPRESAEESCRRMQEVRAGPSDPIQAVAPYEFGFGAGAPRAGESVELTVDWGDGSPLGKLALSGPVEPGAVPAGEWSHTYTEPGTYTWRSSGSRVVLVAISPTEGNLPCSLPVNDTGTITISAPAGGGSAGARSPAVPGATTPVPTGDSAADESPVGAKGVAAGHTESDGDGGLSPLVMVLLGAVGIGAAGLLLGRRSGLFGSVGPAATQHRLRPSEVAGKGVEYIQDVHAEVSDTKASHDAEVARRREELIQHYLPTVGHDRGMAEVLADNDLSQYGSNAPMVNDVGKDALWDAPTKGLRDTWTAVTKMWNTTFGPKP
jgi:hypothetical protein